jgi:bifunctional non-homologous end joining protein LigD
VQTAIIDCELVACDESGQPDFQTLMQKGARSPALRLWAFDLLAVDGALLSAKPLVERRDALAMILADADDQGLQFSQSFSDPIQLLAAAEKLGLEGIVSKRNASPYRSGPSRAWVKAKTMAWKNANARRGVFFGER